jgi:excisionase family DNA binding protein
VSSEPVPPRLTYEQVGSWLGRSSTHVQRLVRERGLPAHHEGRRVWFDRTEVATWLSDHEDEAGDNRITPVRPLKRPGGSQTVYPSQTIGDLDHCWCGDVIDHDWAGKNSGAPHPHEHERTQQVVVVQQEPGDERRIDRKNLKGYHGTLKDFITGCVNVDHLRYRLGRTETILYPPDESRPISVFARNNDSQMRSLRQWYAVHVEPFKEVNMPEAVRHLAEAKNDPAEHPPVPEPDENDGWVTYVTDEGEEIPNFETNGEWVRCRECQGKPTAYMSKSRRGIGGHNRMNHRDTESLRTPEARAKALDTRRYNRLRDQVIDAQKVLAVALGTPMTDPKQVGAMVTEMEQLREQVKAANKRADDAEAKLALMREAFEGLS